MAASASAESSANEERPLGGPSCSSSAEGRYSCMSCHGCSYKLYEFLVLTCNEDAVISFLQDHGALPLRVACPSCGMFVELDKKMRFQCRKTLKGDKKNRRKGVLKRCSFSHSGRNGTFFEDAKISFAVICRFVAYWIFLRPPRTSFLHHELGIASRTIVDWAIFCREVCLLWAINESRTPLGGPGKVVEIDEAKFQKSNHCQRIRGQWVYGGIDRDSRRLFLIPVEKKDSKTLVSVIEQWILPGTIIISNCRRMCNTLKDIGFQNFTVQHYRNFVDPETGGPSDVIERTWREVRQRVPTYGRHDNCFVGYLAEYLFKRHYPDLSTRLHAFWVAVSHIYTPRPPGVEPSPPPSPSGER